MASISIKLFPISVPHYVLCERKDGLLQEGSSSKFKLEEIDSATLSDLCDEFRCSLFKKANKTDPKA